MPDYALMNQCLYEGKAKEVEQMTKDALAEGRPVQEILSDGLIAGMSVVGEDFKHNILYVPEVLIAARVQALGEPGEVLVTRTVKDLVVGSELRFADRGAHELRGVPETWELFGVRA